MCPDRRQHVLPLMFARPLTGVDYVVAKVGAIATILFAFSFLPQVVLFVGNMLVSDSALDYFTGHLDVLWKVPVAVAPARRLLRRHRRGHRVADRPADRRRRGDHRAVPGHVDRVGRSSSARTSSARADRRPRCINVLALPLYLRDLVFLGHIDRDSPLDGVDQRRRCSPSAIVRRRARRRRRRRCCGATAGWSGDDAPTPDRAPRAARPGVRRRRHRRGRRRVGVVRAEGRAVRAELLVRPGRHRPARTERRRQDDADAGDHRPRRRQPGHGARRGPRPAPRPAASTRRMALVPEDEAVPAGLTARQFVRYVADLHGVADRGAPDAALRDGRAARRRRPARRRLQQGHAPAHARSPPRS